MYQPPTPQNINKFIKRYGLTRLAAGYLANMSKESFENYLSPGKKYKMPYSVLFTIAAKNSLDNNELARVQKRIKEFYN